MNGGDDSVRPLEGNHMVTIRNDNLAAARGEMGLADLKIIAPDVFEIIKGFYRKAGRQS